MRPSNGAGKATLLTNAQLGSIATRLALYPELWIERRVDGMRFVDDNTVRQRVSVTIRRPVQDFFPDPAQPKDGQMIYVPLDLLPKLPLRKLDVANEDGSTFALPATARNAEMASVGLAEVISGYSRRTRDGQGLTARSWPATIRVGREGDAPT